MSVDYSAILTDPYATTEQKNKAYYDRLKKEASMKADGTWDNSWATTTDLYTPQPTAADYMAQARREAAQALKNSKTSQKESVAAQSDALERQAYIQMMQSMGNLQAANALSGQTGGLAETTALAPQTAYGNALNTIGANRLEANRQIDQAADAQALQLAVDFADKQINQMNLDREFENANFWNKQNWDFSQQQYADSRSDTAWSQSFQEREAAWDKAVSIIASGTMPPDELLAQAGLTREKAAEMMAYLPKTSSGSGSGGGGLQDTYKPWSMPSVVSSLYKEFTDGILDEDEYRRRLDSLLATGALNETDYNNALAYGGLSSTQTGNSVPFWEQVTNKTKHHAAQDGPLISVGGKWVTWEQLESMIDNGEAQASRDSSGKITFTYTGK